MRRQQEEKVNKMKRNINSRSQKTFSENFLYRLCKNMQQLESNNVKLSKKEAI